MGIFGRYYCVSCMVWARDIKNDKGKIVGDRCPLCGDENPEVRGSMNPKTRKELDANECFVKFMLGEESNV